MSKYAPKREDGLAPYVRSRTSIWDKFDGGSGYETIVWAENLAVAKRDYGWTREAHTSYSIRRATPGDVERLAGHQ